MDNWALRDRFEELTRGREEAQRAMKANEEKAKGWIAGVVRPEVGKFTQQVSGGRWNLKVNPSTEKFLQTQNQSNVSDSTWIEIVILNAANNEEFVYQIDVVATSLGIELGTQISNPGELGARFNMVNRQFPFGPPNADPTTLPGSEVLEDFLRTLDDYWQQKIL